MKKTNIFVFIVTSLILCALLLGFTAPCSAELFPFSFFPSPFFPSVFNPALTVPFLSPIPAYLPPVLSPPLTPYTASMPSLLNRSAAATLVVLPAPAPAVTAYAPLGTLNLTPSTLVFLILLFTLPE